MQVIDRHIKGLIRNALKAFPAVYINGPRQAGKTTLVQDFLSENSYNNFITFDNPIERAAATRNPINYLAESGAPLIIDEIQMVPSIFRPLKMLIDEQRQKALKYKEKTNGNYLLTGSANLVALPELANAMVGRMATITLLPISANEIMDGKCDFLDRCFNKDFTGIKNDRTPISQIIEKTSFPEFLNMEPSMLKDWFANYINKITLEDPKNIYNLEKSEYMPILLQSLATRAGSLVNDANISREIGINAVTTRLYRNLLNNSFITNNLKPWYRNINKRLVKASKIYFYDTMLLCHLLQSSPSEIAKQKPQGFGHIVENFVLSEIYKIKHITGSNTDISFYRTNDGKEIDLVLENKSKIVAIEIKNKENITEKDLLGIKELQEETGKDFICGIVLCNTNRVIAFDKDIYLVPFNALWQ